MTGVTMDVPLKYLSQEPDRYGTVRLYVRRYGRKIRIREVPGSPAFLKAYQKALAELGRDEAKPEPLTEAAAGSVAQLALAYFASTTKFQKLEPRMQRVRRQIIEQCLRESVQADDPKSPKMGEVPIDKFEAEHVRVLRDRKAERPGAARNRIKYLSAMFAWAVENRRAKFNPCRGVEKIKYATDGFHTWTREEVAAYETRHPIGSKARLALALLLFTGARRGDVVTFGRQHVRDGWLRYVPRKTLYKRRRLSEKPVLPVLQDVIERSPTGDLTFLVTEYGKAFTPAGFGGWFRDRCDEAGLKHCSAHGLKKAGATIAAENGATAPQLMAMFDWDTLAQAQVYIDKANRKTMAGAAMGLILSHSAADTAESETKVVGTSKSDT